MQIRAKDLRSTSARIIADSAAVWAVCANFLTISAGFLLAANAGMKDEPSPQRLRTLALQKRSFELSCNVVRGAPKERHLDDPSRIIWRQLIKAVTSNMRSTSRRRMPHQATLTFCRRCESRYAKQKKRVSQSACLQHAV